MSICSPSDIRSSTIGRSPEMPCAQSPDWEPAPCRIVSDAGRNVGVGVDHVSSQALEQAGFTCRNPEVMELNLSLCPRRAWPHARTPSCPPACRSNPATSGASTPPWSRTPPGRSRRGRSVRAGAWRRSDQARRRPCSERGRSPVIASAVRTLRPRPRKRALSVSICGLPITSPSTTARCAAQISGSDGARRRRVATIAPTLSRYSVSTNSLEKAGCATIGACGPSAISAYEVTSISRAGFPYWKWTPGAPRHRPRRNQHLKFGRQRAVASGEDGKILAECHRIFIRLDARRLTACRPDVAALRVPKKNIRAANRLAWRLHAIA